MPNNQLKAQRELKKKTQKKKQIKSERSGEVSLLTPVRSAPVSVGYRNPGPRMRAMMPQHGGCSRFEGVDFVGSLASKVSTPTIGVYKTITMEHFSTETALFPRLVAIASAYAKYKLLKLRIHMVGTSASTQAGVGAFSSLIIDSQASGAVLNTDPIIKNLEGCIVLKGWESGFHDVKLSAQGFKWYNVDVDGDAGGPYTPGVIVVSIPTTTNAGDLSWDVFIEYDIEFNEAVSQATNADPLSKRGGRKKRLEDQIRTLQEEVQNLA